MATTIPGTLFGLSAPEDLSDASDTPASESGELVWQYRGQGATESILRQHAFRAFDVRSFEDDQELRTGIAKLHPAYRRLVAEWDPRDEPGRDWAGIARPLMDAAKDIFRATAFVCCFSHDGDLPAQWEAYTGEDGFSIGIPEGVRLPVLGTEDNTRHAFYDETPLRWLPMLYGASEQSEAVQAAIHAVIREYEVGYPGQSDPEFDGSSMFRDRLSSEYACLVARIKAERYRSEAEVRYTLARSHSSGGIKIEDRGERGSREYVEVTGAAGDPFDVDWDWHEPVTHQVERSVLPIRAIYISPKADFNAQRSWLEAVLEDSGYTDVEIRRSRVK